MGQYSVGIVYPNLQKAETNEQLLFNLTGFNFKEVNAKSLFTELEPRFYLGNDYSVVHDGQLTTIVNFCINGETDINHLFKTLNNPKWLLSFIWSDSGSTYGFEYYENGISRKKMMIEEWSTIVNEGVALEQIKEDFDINALAAKWRELNTKMQTDGLTCDEQNELGDEIAEIGQTLMGYVEEVIDFYSHYEPLISEDMPEVVKHYRQA